MFTRRLGNPRALSIQPKFPGWGSKITSNGSRRVRTVSFHSTRKTSFALIEMEDVESLLVLELHDDFDSEISHIV